MYTENNPLDLFIKVDLFVFKIPTNYMIFHKTSRILNLKFFSGLFYLSYKLNNLIKLTFFIFALLRTILGSLFFLS